MHAPARPAAPLTAPARTAAGAGLRGLVVRLHRYFGLAIALFLVLAGLTGSLLVFQTELDAALNPRLFQIEATGPSLSPQDLADRIEAADPRVRARWIPLESEPSRAADVWVEWKVNPATGTLYPAEYNQVFINPVTGEIQGRRTYGAPSLARENLIPFLHTLHSNLYLPGRLGAFLLGTVAILWAIDSLFGFYLTLPKGGPFWRKWGKSWQLKPNASTERRTLDIHRAGGLWLWPVLFVMAVSGVALTLEHEVFEPVVNSVSPVSEPRYLQRPMAPPEKPIEARLSFNEALARATLAARAAGIHELTSGLYNAAELGVYGVGFGTEAGPGIGASWVFVDSRTGETIDVVAATGGTAGDIFMRMQLALHSGTIAGLPTKILAAAAGVLTATLSVTGVILWARKRRARRIRALRAALA
ncbi:PepSY-associated TM helix domain-containing protein [Pedomonas mirosovicensis]|uniref:PepSY-associated TM helix domain-containing protein n=1 Tax=Pedomonas mirosovicensis TaxID=2908641 RepID=UPI00216711C4|nr:PepSY-associated TM helix domain-containing protein [Pedomonas mirosovicensis]MCH8686562.1 PepSY domain-containing protein [Pedomonas mirosovicensis]